MKELAGTGAGKRRRPFIIREFLAKKGFNMMDVSQKVGVSHTLVRDTIIGARNNQRVLQYLHGLGCPEKYLSMPKQSRA